MIRTTQSHTMCAYSIADLQSICVQAGSCSLAAFAKVMSTLSVFEETMLESTTRQHNSAQEIEKQHMTTPIKKLHQSAVMKEFLLVAGLHPIVIDGTVLSLVCKQGT
jgi:hypothetical protein